MAICASCGAATAEGASACAACGRPVAPPPPPPGHGPGHPPPAGPGYGPPPPTAPPALGSWGGGRPYDPAAGQSAALRWLAGSDWRPALRVAVAPTLVLLLAALIAAVPADYQYAYLFRAPDFGERFGATLATALNALGAPFKLGYAQPARRGDSQQMDVLLRVVPMTVTLLWTLALWLGLRAGVRRRKAVTGQLTRGQAAGEALRTAVVLAAVTLLLGLLGGTTWQPQQTGRYPDTIARHLGITYTADTGWLEAVAWTALLAGVTAFAVYGTDALRWAAWRSRAVRGWAVAALTAGRALALTLGLASVAGFILVAATSDGQGWRTGLSLAFLPNVGLFLLGLGSGATFQAHSGLSDPDKSWRSGRDDLEFSFFDLHDQTADWRWTGLLALAAAGVLGWSAYRRQLDAADRLRLAAVHAVALTALMAVAGAVMTTTMTFADSGWGASRGSDLARDTSVSLGFGSLLLANLVWAAIGALVVPALLAAGRGRGPAAPYGAVPPPGVPYPAGAPETVPYRGVVDLGKDQGGSDQGGSDPVGSDPVGSDPVGSDPVGSDQGGAPVVPAQGAPGAGVSEVIGSHEEPAAPPPGAAAAASAGAAEDPVDPSVWREHP
ncbi:hypothetical protein [Kitasatospora sp. NPDC097643]|uniref:hypothetical protein n=1 Tax=Kitasatospora sp. NPDC097643 TaxID=3157230 RepID=UPI0033245B01